MIFNLRNCTTHYRSGCNKKLLEESLLVIKSYYFGTDEWSSPKVCGMASVECDIIGGWTLGENGQCQNENHGIPVGLGYYTKVLMEHHWNNPSQEVNY